MSASKGDLKLRFVKSGTTFLAKLHAQIDVVTTSPQAVPTGGTIYEGGWTISHNFNAIAPENKFPEAMKTFGIVLTSCRTDKHFYNTMMQASRIIMRNFYSRERQIMQTSRIISQTNDEMLAALDKQYTASQVVEEREATGFDDYIRS